LLLLMFIKTLFSIVLLVIILLVVVLFVIILLIKSKLWLFVFHLFGDLHFLFYFFQGFFV
jgi:hypothetical protein